MANKMLIVRGIQGSGKSSFVPMFFPESSYELIEPDQYMVNDQGEYEYSQAKLGECIAKCNAKARELAATGQNIVLCGTFGRKVHFQVYLDLAKEFGYEVAVITINKFHNNKNIHNVPDEAIERTRNMFEHYL